MKYLVEFQYKTADGEPIISRFYTDSKYKAEEAVVKLQHDKSKPQKLRYWIYENITGGQL